MIFVILIAFCHEEHVGKVATICCRRVIATNDEHALKVVKRGMNLKSVEWENAYCRSELEFLTTSTYDVYKMAAWQQQLNLKEKLNFISWNKKSRKPKHFLPHTTCVRNNRKFDESEPYLRPMDNHGPTKTLLCYNVRP